jgi:uncharacterized protein with ParB-like and HNH nuclease domain
MKANATPLVTLFEKKMRLEVPLFQRQYVWTESAQWEPLWEDIERKFTEYLEGRDDAPVHFLGAIVLDQKQTPATHVERRLVIDGQQRLTTLQIFLTAFRDYCRAAGAEALAEECTNFTLNKGMMPDPEVDKFKVWPTSVDRKPFQDVVNAGSKEALENLHPLIWKKYARKPEPRHAIVSCYLFFYEQISLFFEGFRGELPVAHEVTVDVRLESCFQALRNALLVVAIDLEQGDDAQVIFETLNARGEPLLPADLLRNYIFLRAARHNESQEALYKRYWEKFDEPFWRTSVSQGRINRPRSDLFMQHFLASQQAIDIPVKHLYVEYRHWIEKEKPFDSVESELQALARQRDNFRRLLEAEADQPFTSLANFLIAYDVGTAYPLLLHLLDSGASDDVIGEVSIILESYLQRRAVCNMTNKNLNRVFLNLVKILRREGTNVDVVKKYLLDLKGESAEWPSDEAFFNAWQSNEIYQQLNNARITHIFSRLDAKYRSSKTEDILVASPLTVEHIMPQEWTEHWPLEDGEQGLSMLELWEAEDDDLRASRTKVRNSIIQTMGNLTLIRQGLNASMSNSNWLVKKPELMKYSVLSINQEFYNQLDWNEREIAARGRRLFQKALEIWSRPAS